MQNGTVKWFDTTKGYRLIRPQGNGEDVFVYIRALEQQGVSDLSDGQEVSV